MREESLARKNAGSLPWRDLGPRVPCTDCAEHTSSPRGPEACTSMGILILNSNFLKSPLV